jgi:hypothetical protein
MISAHGQHLLLAARHRAALLTLALAQPREQREDALDVVADAGAVAARERAHLEVLAHRHPREDPPALGRLGDAQGSDLVPGEAGDLDALEADVARPGRHDAGDRSQRRGLPRAVGADQRHDLAVADLERDALERLDRPVVRVDVLDAQQHVVAVARRLGDLLRARHAWLPR